MAEQRNRLTIRPNATADSIFDWREVGTQVTTLARKTVDLVNYPDDRFAVRYMGTNLPFRAIDKIRAIEPGTIADNKRLTEVLAYVQQRQAVYASHQNRHHPARQRPPNNLKAPRLPA